MGPRFRRFNFVAFASFGFGSVWRLLAHCYVIRCFFQSYAFWFIAGAGPIITCSVCMLFRCCFFVFLYCFFVFVVSFFFVCLFLCCFFVVVALFLLFIYCFCVVSLLFRYDVFVVSLLFLCCLLIVFLFRCCFFVVCSLFVCCFLVVSLFLCCSCVLRRAVERFTISGWAVDYLSFLFAMPWVAESTVGMTIRTFIYLIGRRHVRCIVQRRGGDDPPSVRTWVYVFVLNLTSVLLFVCWSIVALVICRSVGPGFRRFNCVVFAPFGFGTVWGLLAQCYFICCFFNHKRFGLLGLHAASFPGRGRSNNYVFQLHVISLLFRCVSLFFLFIFFCVVFVVFVVLRACCFLFICCFFVVIVLVLCVVLSLFR